MTEYRYRNPQTVRAVQWRGDNEQEVKDELGAMFFYNFAQAVFRNMGPPIGAWCVLRDNRYSIMSDADFRAAFIVEGESEEADA